MEGGADRVPKWEAELWRYVSSGDGVRWPMYDDCRARIKCILCISGDPGRLEQLPDTSKLNPGNYDFLGCVPPGRIFELVEMLAQSILRKAGVPHPPVPEAVVSLADEQNPIEIRLVPLTVHRGAIWRLRDSWIIQLNRNAPLAQRRFTLFHEAFHILAHCRATPVFGKIDCEAGSFNELLADCFAFFIMMPRKWVEEKWVEINDADKMAKTFDVSVPQMRIRLEDMGLI